MENDDDSTKEGSEIFHDILAILQKSYVYDESKQSFRYKSAFLIKNNILRKQYDDFRERRRVLGYSEDELKESFGFLLFDDYNKAKKLADKGVLTGNCTFTTLGDPSNGVYISKYSDCLDLNRWYHEKSGFIAIIKLTKGRIRKVSENYTQTFTAPSVGFDCHESTQLDSVSSNTSSFLAFERTQYYMYELLHNESNDTSRSPSHACPFAVVSFSYTDSNTFTSEPQLKREDKKTVFYFPWMGQLQVSSQLYSLKLKSTVGALLPAKLPAVVKVDRAISMSDLRKLVPKAIFENVFSGEGYLDGIFCSLYEFLPLVVEDKSLSLLIQQLKENDLALIIQLNDCGFLVLLHSSHFLAYNDTGSRAAEALQGMFLFPSSRAVQKDIKDGRYKSTVASDILKVLPALMYAESEVEKTFNEQNEKPCDLVAHHIQCYGTLVNPGLATVLPREAGIFPDMYDVPDTLQYLYSAPKWTSGECQSLMLYISQPVSFQLPVSRVTDLLTSGQEEPVDDVYICLSSPESAPDPSVSMMSNAWSGGQKSPTHFGTLVDNVKEYPAGAQDGSVSDMSDQEPGIQESPAYARTFVNSCTSSVKESPEAAPDISVNEMSNEWSGSRESPAYGGTFVESFTASEAAPDISVSMMSNQWSGGKESPTQVGTCMASCTTSVNKALEGAPAISVSAMSKEWPESQEASAHGGVFVDSCTTSVNEQNELASRSQNEMSILTKGTTKDLTKTCLPVLTNSDNISKTKGLWISKTSGELPTELILSITSAEGTVPVPDQRTDMICTLSASKNNGTQLFSSSTAKSEVIGTQSLNNNIDSLLDCPKDSSPITANWKKIPRGRKKGRKVSQRLKLPVVAGNLTPEEQAKDRQLSDFSKANHSSRTDIKSMKPAIKHNIIEQYGLSNIPIRKVTERWYLKPVITECGSILVPHGSVVKDDNINSLKGHPKATDRKQSPDKGMVETVQLMDMEQETNTAFQKTTEKNNYTPILQNDTMQNLDLHHEHSQNKELKNNCVSELINSEANNKNCCNETLVKARGLPAKPDEVNTKNSELLFSRLKSVILNGKRKSFNLDNAQDGEPFIKKKSDSFIEPLRDTNKCPIDIELASDEVSKPVDPHFAHALRLTPKNVTNKEQKSLGKEQKTQTELRDSPNLQDNSMSQTISVSISDKLEPLIRQLTPAPGKVCFKTSHEKSNKPTEYLRKKWWLHFHAPTYYAKDRRKYNICTGINSTKKNMKDKLQSTCQATAALTLLADLALSASSDETSQQPDPAPDSDLEKCDLTKDGPSSERETVLHSLLKQPPTLPILSPKSPLPKGLPAIEDINVISKEHAYSFSPSSSLLLGLSVIPFQVPSSCDSAGQQHQNVSREEMLSLCQKSKLEVHMMLQQKEFRDFRNFVEKDGSIKVTRQWKEDYDFALDSRFANDSMDKTVTRALHGPWDFNIRDTSEEVLFIVHMWIGLFYSRSTRRFFHIDPSHAYSGTSDCMEMSGMTPELSQAAVKTSSIALVPSLTSASKVTDLRKKRTPALNQESLVLDLSLRDPYVEHVLSNRLVRSISENHKLSVAIGPSPDLNPLHEANRACLQSNYPRFQTFRNQVELDELDVKENNGYCITKISERINTTQQDGNLEHCDMAQISGELLDILCKEMSHVNIQQENVFETKGIAPSPGPCIGNTETGDGSKKYVKAELRMTMQHTVIDNSAKVILAVDLNRECPHIIHQDEEDENKPKCEDYQIHANGKALDEVTISSQEQTLTLVERSQMELSGNESGVMDNIELAAKVHIEKLELAAFDDSDTALFYYQDAKRNRLNEIALSSVQDQKPLEEFDQNTVFHQKAQPSESENSNKWEDQMEQNLERHAHFNQNIVECSKKLDAKMEIPFSELQASSFQLFEQMVSSNSILHDRCPTPTIDEKPYSYSTCSEPCSSATILKGKGVNKASIPRSDEMPLEDNICPLSPCDITTSHYQDESIFSLHTESQPRTALRSPPHQLSNLTELMNYPLGPGVGKNSEPIALSSHAVHPSKDEQEALHCNSDDKLLSHSARPVMAVKPSKCNGSQEDCIYKEGEIVTTDKPVVKHTTQSGRLPKKPSNDYKCKSRHSRNKNYHKHTLVGKGGPTNKDSIKIDEAPSVAVSNLMLGCNRERLTEDEKVTLRPSTSSMICTIFNSGKDVANILVDELSQRCLYSDPTQASIEEDFLIFLQQMKRLVNRSKRGSRFEQTNTDDSTTLHCPSPMTVDFSRLQEVDDSLDHLEELPSLDGQKIKIELPDRRCLSGATDGLTMLHLHQLSYDTGDAAERLLVSDLTAKCTSSYKAMMNDVCEGKKNVTQWKDFDRQFVNPDHVGQINTGQMKREMYENLQSNLNLVVRQTCKTKYRFYILATSDDSFFVETKAQLKAEGHTEVLPSQFFLVENSSSLLIILKNEDIAEHICEVPHLLELKKSSDVLFAGIDLPDDITNLTYQEILSSGGFIVFERATLQALSVRNLKRFLEMLEEHRKKDKWQWLLHYKDSRYLKENLWLNADVKEKKFLIERCQETGIAEILPYHECDLMTTNQPNYLTCLVHLQIQKISARFPVFITDATPDSRFGRNGILAMNMSSFLFRFQR